MPASIPLAGARDRCRSAPRRGGCRRTSGRRSPPPRRRRRRAPRRPWAPEVPWLQPFPDDLLDAEPPADAVVEARETIALAFLAALRHLPPRQRAVLILSDVVGWSAAEIAELLDLTVPSVTSALQRARSTLRARFPAGAPDPSAGAQVTGRERAALKVFMDAWEQVVFRRLGSTRQDRGKETRDEEDDLQGRHHHRVRPDRAAGAGDPGVGRVQRPDDGRAAGSAPGAAVHRARL
ncbi:sigma factor-like helix-turn-helix DNA-binding protein [Sorangium sp. So ce216]